MGHLGEREVAAGAGMICKIGRLAGLGKDNRVAGPQSQLAPMPGG
jgi:hypothetical protein